MKKGLTLDLTQGRLTNLSLIEKATGTHEYVLFSTAKRTVFLEGYITGMVTDYAGDPIQGVIVRAALKGAVAAPEAGAAPLETASKEISSGGQFDPGISDTQGIYRVRFSLPMVDDKVDVLGRLIYNPSWEQEKATLGRTYEPQLRESEFRLYFDASQGLAAFSDGLSRVIVQPVVGKGEPTVQQGVRAPAAPQAATPRAAPASADDLFRSFGFGQ
jgi:hypothetical protein